MLMGGIVVYCMRCIECGIDLALYVYLIHYMYVFSCLHLHVSALVIVPIRVTESQYTFA